jgi:hypothetical protein
MFRLILALMVATGCGSSDDDDTKDAEKILDVVRLGFDDDYCTAELNKCTVTIDGTITNNENLVGTNYVFVLAMEEGDDAPEECDSDSEANSGAATYIMKTALKLETKYSFRGCLFNANSNSYTPGVAGSHTTPAS